MHSSPTLHTSLHNFTELKKPQHNFYKQQLYNYTVYQTLHTKNPYTTLQNLTNLLQDFAQHYTTIQNYTELNNTLHKFTKLYTNIQNFTKLLQISTKLYETLQRLYKTLQSFTQQHLQNYTTFTRLCKQTLKLYTTFTRLYKLYKTLFKSTQLYKQTLQYSGVAHFYNTLQAQTLHNFST